MLLIFRKEWYIFAHRSNGDAKLKVLNVLDVNSLDDIFREPLEGKY